MFGLTPGSMTDTINVRAEFACRVPDGLSFAQAAGVPLPFLTAWYALVELAALRPGTRVLVHAAAGGVGQAAVAIARSCGAEIFATASEPKQRVLREQGLQAIFDSRSTEFRAGVLAATGGAGVDVVLNCLSGDLIAAGLDCLRPRGRFIEIGKTGIWEAARVTAYRPDVCYSVFDLADVGRDEPVRIGRMLTSIADAPRRPGLQPIPTAPSGEGRHGRVSARFARPSHRPKSSCSRRSPCRRSAACMSSPERSGRSGARCASICSRVA